MKSSSLRDRGGPATARRQRVEHVALNCAQVPARYAISRQARPVVDRRRRLVRDARRSSRRVPVPFTIRRPRSVRSRPRSGKFGSLASSKSSSRSGMRTPSRSPSSLGFASRVRTRRSLTRCHPVDRLGGGVERAQIERLPHRGRRCGLNMAQRAVGEMRGERFAAAPASTSVAT